MHLAGVGVDVSEQYAMEFSLRQSEEKFRRVVEGLSEGVMLVDLSTMPLYQAKARGRNRVASDATESAPALGAVA